LIVTADITADTTDRTASGISIKVRGRKSPHTTPRSRPNTVPRLDTIDSRAKADVHFAFGCVSIIRRFRGVAAADEKKEIDE
jgi:hypothetical protein